MYVTRQAREFAEHIKGLGFRVFLAKSKTHGFITDEKRERANAIVTAVNSHAELVEALRDLVNGVHSDEISLRSDGAFDAVKRAEALLNRIGGR